MTGDGFYGYLPVGKFTGLLRPCQEYGQGCFGAETERRRDIETEEQKDNQAIHPSVSPSLRLSVSPSLCLSISVAQLRIVVFGGSFAKLNRLLATFAGSRFMRADVAYIAKVIEVMQFAVAPGLKFDDFDEVCGWEDSRSDL